jgi:altronate dehydratase
MTTRNRALQRPLDKIETLRHEEHALADAGGVVAGTEDAAAAGDRLWSLALEIASGTRSWGEVLAEGDASFVRTGGSI